MLDSMLNHHHAPGITNGTVRKELVTRVYFNSTRTTKWTRCLKLCSITWEVRPCQPKPAKAPQLFYTELAKAMARTHMHPTEQPFPHFFSHIGFDTHAMSTAR